MSYTKTNWHDGDTITAVKMNKIENGIESSLSDALVTLGKALCGDSFEVKPGLTDAETILEIAKNYEGGSGSGSGGSGGGRIIELTPSDEAFLPIEPNLPIEYFAGACIESDGQYSIIKNVLGEYDGQGNVIGCEFTVETPNGTITCVYVSSDGSISIAD